MASNVHLSTTARNTAIDNMLALLNAGGAGTLKFYDGSQPANANTAITSQTLLATLTLNSTAFASSSGGSASLNGVPLSASIVATSTCTWGTFVNNAGTRVMDFSVGTSSADCNFNSVAFQNGATCSVSSFTVAIQA